MTSCVIRYATAAILTAALPVAHAFGGDEEDVEISPSGMAALDMAEDSLAADPQPTTDHGGAISYLYGSGHPELVCSPYNICRIALEPGEYLITAGVQIGDNTRWIIEPLLAANRQTFLTVKPTMPNLRTNLVIHTDRRNYTIALVSHPERYMPIISFRYPNPGGSSPESGQGIRGQAWDNYHAALVEDREADAAVERMTAAPPPPVHSSSPAALRPEDLDHRYDTDPCRRCKAFDPVTVYNDGIRTWIVLPEDYKGDLPIFVMASGRGTVPVQSRWEHGKLMVEAVFERGFLVVGRKKVEIIWYGASESAQG